MSGVDIHALAMRVVWDRRRAFLAEAVRRRILSEEQVDLLLALHAERDAEQEARDVPLRNDDENLDREVR